jgi:hypothetical protein
VNTRDGQERLPRQFLPKCTFSVGIVAMARIRPCPLTMSSPSDSLPQPELPHGFCCSLCRSRFGPAADRSDGANSPNVLYRRRTAVWARFDSVCDYTRTSILDAVDLLTENQGPIAPTRPRSVYFDIVVEAGRAGFDADSFHQGLQEALVQDPDL